MGKKKKKKVEPPKKPPPAAPAPVGRDQAPNVLQDGEVFVLQQTPAIADDEYLLVPLKKDTKKKPPTVSKSKVSDVHTAIEFANVVMTKDFKYDLIHVRAGKVKNRVRGNLSGSSLPTYTAQAALPVTEFAKPKKTPKVDESAKDPDLKDDRVTDFLSLEAEDPEE